VGRLGIEREPTDYVPATACAATRHPSVWSLDFAFTFAVTGGQWVPSSLYNLPLSGLGSALGR